MLNEINTQTAEGQFAIAAIAQMTNEIMIRQPEKLIPHIHNEVFDRVESMRQFIYRDRLELYGTDYRELWDKSEGRFRELSQKHEIELREERQRADEKCRKLVIEMDNDREFIRDVFRKVRELKGLSPCDQVSRKNIFDVIDELKTVADEREEQIGVVKSIHNVYRGAWNPVADATREINGMLGASPNEVAAKALEIVRNYAKRHKSKQNAGSIRAGNANKSRKAAGKKAGRTGTQTVDRNSRDVRGQQV